MAQNFSANQINDLLKQAAKQPDLLNKMSGKTPDEILKQLPPEQADQIQSLMKNEELKQKLINSPQAQMLMKMFMKGKGGN